MKKLILSPLFVMLSNNALASDWGMHCGDIKRMRTWVNGSDAYGVWVE